MGHRWQRYLAIGVLGAALLFALAAGLAARLDTTPAAAVPADQGVAVPVNPPGVSYPTYRLSAPNEQDPQGDVGGAAAGSRPAYRVSPPNEVDPAGSQQPSALTAAAGATPGPGDLFDWEQYERTGLARYQPTDTFDWEQYERTR